jgi:hypothetical protein
LIRESASVEGSFEGGAGLHAPLKWARRWRGVRAPEGGKRRRWGWVREEAEQSFGPYGSLCPFVPSLSRRSGKERIAKEV